MTIKEIAKLAGVSISTVSKVMNHKDSSIRPETREKILRIAREFNYAPYSGAHAPGPATKTPTIGVLVRSADACLALSEIIKCAGKLGYSVLVSECDMDPEQEFRGITALCRAGVDGVLWEPLNADSIRYAESFRATGIPYLFFNTAHSDAAINIDFEQMGYDATNELIRSGHEDIACLLFPGTRTERFLTGYRRCLFDAGIPFQEHLVYREIPDELIHKITGHMVTGVVCSHFTEATRLYRALYNMHYQVPHDVSLIALRNDSRETVTFPEISTFTTPHFQFGRHLCRELASCIEKPDHAPAPFVNHPTLDSDVTIATPFTKRSKPLLVVGSVNIDYYLKMNRLPTTGKSVITSSSSVHPGGKGINQAVGIAKLGARATLIGTVGGDLDSDLIYSALEKHAIDSAGVRRYADAATGKAYIFVQQDGDSMISVLSGANNHLTPDDIYRDSRYFEACKYCLIQTEIPMDTVITACRQAKACGAATILKPAACSALPEELLQYVDILIPNLDEINLLAPEGTLREQTDHFLAHGIGTVIVTLGADGSYLRTRDLEMSIPAVPFHSVDNTGASDAFISALAVFLQEKYPIQKAVRIATYAAGFCITREGVPDSLVDRGTLETYIRQHEPELLERNAPLPNS